MRRDGILPVFCLLPLLSMGAALSVVGMQVQQGVEERARHARAGEAMQQAAHIVLEVRRANFSLMRYASDLNPKWVVPLNEAKHQIPDMLKELDAICVSSKSREAGKLFSESLGKLVALDDEIVWISQLSPADLAPIRARQLRSSVQAGWRSVNADQLALADILSDEATHAYIYHALLPLWLAAIAVIGVVVACTEALRKTIRNDAHAIHSAFRTELRKQLETKRIAEADSDRVHREREVLAQLEEKEASLLESIRAPLVVMQADGKILRANSLAREFLDKLGNPEFLFIDQLKEAGMAIDIETQPLESGGMLCKISG